MPDAAKRSTDLIIGRGLIGAEAVASELRSRLVNRIARQRSTFSDAQLLDLARRILAEFEPLLADSLYDTEIAAWVSGVDYVAGRLPLYAEAAIGELSGPVFPGSEGSGAPPTTITTIFQPPSGGDPIIHFPGVEKAARSILERRVMRREDFDRLAADARNQAFTVAKVQSEETLLKIRDTLGTLVREGPSLREFKEQLADVLDASHIGPGRLETVYRTNVQTAYMQGHDSLADNPVVAALFPYVAYLAIDDGRVRDEHLALMELGIDGTNIYRADDPFWEVFGPPWDFNCRCGKNLLTIESAARKGVREANDWQNTGIMPPLNSRLPYIPFRPKPGWGGRRRLAA